jgi:hypothetical protein
MLNDAKTDITEAEYSTGRYRSRFRTALPTAELICQKSASYTNIPRPKSLGALHD